jgi:hypothetical protein
MQDVFPLVVIALMLAGISATIVARVPARRLVPAMLLWLFAPAIPMAIVLALGSLGSSPGVGSAGYNAAFGIMLIGTIVLIPWLIVCGLGFAIGFVLRRRRRPAEAAPGGTSAPPEPDVAGADGAPADPGPPQQRFLRSDTSAPHFSHVSPDGSVRIDIEPFEWAPGQWAQSPCVIDAATGRILCDLHGGDWEAQTAFPRPRSVWLGLRRQGAPGHLFAELDLAADRYRIACDSLDRPDEEGTLGDIGGRLEHWWPCAARRASHAARTPPPAGEGPGAGADSRTDQGAATRPTGPSPFAAWRTALLILAGALIAIAILVYLSEEHGIDPPDVPLIFRPGTAR